jgi:hypothetical protein
MEKNRRLTNVYFLLGLGLVSLFAYNLIFSTIGFIRGYSISGWQFPVSIVMMLVTQYYAARELFTIKPFRVFLQTSGILVAILAVSIVFSSAFYDVSFDGQWYHQETVIRLKKGWNPYFKEFPVPKIAGIPKKEDAFCSGPHVPPTENPNADQPVIYIKYVSVNYFAKGAEITWAAIYAMTGHIESAKALNVICLFASLFLCLSVLYKMGRWSAKKIWLLSLLLSLNPVTIYQLTSFCVDGLMYSMMLSLLATFVLICLEKNKYVFFIFGLLIMIGVNIKFTSVVFTGLFCLGFFVFLLLKKQWILVRKVLIAGTISCLLGLVFIGFHPYITNLITYNNPFHGLTETRNVNQTLKPEYFMDKNRFIEFFVSYSARSYDTAASGQSLKDIVKIPFTFNKTELLNANNVELSIAGFGPFFGGALWVWLIFLVVVAVRYYKNPSFKIYCFLSGFLLLTVFIMPDPWWARFVPQLWILPIALLIFAEYAPVTNRFFKPLLYISLFMNVVWALSGILLNLMVSAHINYQIAQLKTVNSPISVEYCGYGDMRSNVIRFEENDIPYVEKFVTGKHIYNVIHSSTRFETPEELPVVHKSFFMRLNEKLHGKNAE